MLKRAIYLLLVVDTVSLIAFTFVFISRSNQPTNSVAGAKAPTPTRTIKAASVPTFTPTPTAIRTRKQSYTIAVFGDSMVDTMGENLEYLAAALKGTYPSTQFKLYNYGIGSQNIEQGLARFNQSFSYQTRNYPPITQIGTDIIILGSFAYNPFLIHDRNKHYLMLIDLVREARKTGADVYLLAEIAPLNEGFGQGPHGPNMSASAATEQANRIIEQLEDAENVAAAESVKLINVFRDTQVNGKYGSKFDVNPDDGIHPSVAGHQFTAQEIVSLIVLK